MTTTTDAVLLLSDSNLMKYAFSPDPEDGPGDDEGVGDEGFDGDSDDDLSDSDEGAQEEEQDVEYDA